MQSRTHITLMFLLAGFGTAGTPLTARCPTRKVGFKVTGKMLVRQEKAEKEGHQPWRSDPKFVAGVGVMRADPGVHPQEVHHFAVSAVKQTRMKAVFLFKAPAGKRSYRVTVQRFRIRMPDSHKLTTTVWWTTGVVIADCSKRAGADKLQSHEPDR